MTIRVVVLLSIAMCLGATACGPSEPQPPPGARRLTEAEKAKIVPREHFAVPLEERPVLGKIGDTTCATTENDLLLEAHESGCLSLLKDTIKIGSAASAEAGVRLARLRVAFHQPGPIEKGEPVGWALYATRTLCDTSQVSVLGYVLYNAGGVEISRATPVGGPLHLPEEVAVSTLVEGVCGTDLP